MGRATAIEWADSTLNLMMGCDGCELASRGGSGTCYAEILTNRYGGKSAGYPEDFYKPKLFPQRLAEAMRWPDLTGTDRPDKPWLNGLPRHIFLDDMGDTFTESLPVDWIWPHIPAMHSSRHVLMFLTKRPRRMRESFAGLGFVPSNFLLGTSITDARSLRRVVELQAIPDARRYLSVEPLIGPVDLGGGWLDGIELVIIGGESGPKARPVDLAWVRRLVARCRQAGASVFVKQLGRWITANCHDEPGRAAGTLVAQSWLFPDGSRFVPPLIGPNAFTRPRGAIAFSLADSKGGNMREWPEDLRVREMPR